MMTVPVGIVGIGTYFPAQIESAADLVARSGIPEEVLIEKMGIRERRIAAEHETVSFMAAEAGRRAIAQAGIDPAQINAVIYHGSEYKEHVVWNGAGKIQHLVGAHNAFAFEVNAVCAGGPIAWYAARSMMQGDPSLEYVLVTVATRENDIINLANARSRFMFNFSSGAAAMLLKRGETHNQILGMSAITDGSLADIVVLNHTPEAIGDDGPARHGDFYGRLDVLDLDTMSARLAEVTMPNFLKVMRQAVEKSGAALSDVRFLGITHMKRSFWLELLTALGLTPAQSVYLENHGHVQSADAIITIEFGLQEGKIKDGDLLVLAGAGAGYTWSAACVRWG